MSELKCVPTLSLEKPGVAVHEGIMNLSGTVPKYPQKFAAEKAALGVRGLKGVAEQTEVRFSAQHKPSDADLAEAVA